MPKFFVKQEQIKDKTIVIQGNDINHIKNVLRMKLGDILHICIIETAQECIATIQKMADTAIFCDIIEYKNTQIESNIKITIFQGLPKSDKMELIIQKAVELGVYDIYPVEMKRCIMKIKEPEKKILRWQKIAEVASKQCGRNIIPQIRECIVIADICGLFTEYDAILVAYEEEKENILKKELQHIKENFNKDENLKLGIVIGPEGGLELKEVELLQSKGAKVVTLGKRILRTETVALNVLSNIMYEFEE